MSTSNLEDNYLSPDQYAGYNPDADGFARFTHPQNGQWYFAYHQYGELILRSEGYLQESGRDNGIASVKKYKDDDANYRVSMQPDGQWVLELWAANNKEIARSVRFASETEARRRLPSALAIQNQMAFAARYDAAREDDYLTCKEYENQPRIPEHREFSLFDKDGEYYFGYMGDGNEVLLRSEGYKSEDGRVNGMQSVLRNKIDRDRYRIEEKMGYYFVVLTAANNKEIARSCPKSEAEANALINLLIGVKPFAAQYDAAREDDYLACKEYDNQPRIPDHREFSLFEKDKEYYFGYMGDGDEVLLRSEGYKSEDGRVNGMQSVLRNKDDRDRYRIEEKMGYYFVVLTAANRKEIARSCPKSEAGALALLNLLLGVVPAAVPIAPVAAVAAAVAAAPLVAPIVTPVAAPVAAPVPVSKSGLGWLWWLLIPLLLLLGYLLWKGCNKQEDVTASAAVAPVDTIKAEAPKVDTTKAVAKPAPAARLDLCGWAPVHFGYGQSEFSDTSRSHIQRVVDLLKSDASYTASFVGNTDDKGTVEFNVALANRRATKVKDMAVQLGADASRISLSENNEQDPAATNANEEGRAYNRRVVMYVYDANKNLVCKKVEAAVPAGLKAN